MAGASFTYDLGGFDKAIARAVASLGRTQALAETIGETLVSSVQMRFEREMGPDGERWVPSKRAEREGGKTLTNSSDLKRSIVYEASPRLVAVGTNKVYAAPHQFGADYTILSSRRRVQLPARPFLGFSEDDKAEVQALIRDHVAGTILGTSAAGRLS